MIFYKNNKVMSYYKKKLIWKYFLNLKYAKRIRESFEEMMLDDFEEKCFNEDNWNYLI